MHSCIQWHQRSWHKALQRGRSRDPLTHCKWSAKVLFLNQDLHSEETGGVKLKWSRKETIRDRWNSWAGREDREENQKSEKASHHNFEHDSETAEEIALWSEQSYPEPCFLLKFMENWFHMKRSKSINIECEQCCYREDREYKERNTIPTDHYNIPRETCPRIRRKLESL